jgi:steroid 5-alpha reductase family enzyme
MTDTSKYLKKAFALYTLVYILALIVAVIVGYAARNLNPVFIVLIADIAATLVVYGMGRLFHNASLYDAYWSVAPLVITIFWVFGPFLHRAVMIRQVIVSVFVFIWGFRLTWNWAHQWQEIKHEDWRYRDLREKNPLWFWLIELVGIEVMPTVIVFLACLPLYPVLVAGTGHFGVLDMIACIITVGAIAIETIADRQLWQFTRQKTRSGEIMTKGLWAYSRHPNYFGEITFWWGIYLFGLAANAAYWWTIIGPLSITLLFALVSVPLMEKRNLAGRPGYAAIIKQIPPLILWFPKNN